MLFNITADPEERHDLSAQHPDVVARLLARIQEFQASEWLDPQWEPYKTCDTAGGSCAKQAAAYKKSARKRGCCGPFVAE